MLEKLYRQNKKNLKLLYMYTSLIKVDKILRCYAQIHKRHNSHKQNILKNFCLFMAFIKYWVLALAIRESKTQINLNM